MQLRLTVVLVLCLTLFVLGGCSLNGPLPPAGMIATTVTAPDAASTLAMRTGNPEDVTNEKVGTATCTAILGAFSFGNCGIDAAMTSGDIKNVHHVDFKKTIVLFGLVHTLTTQVFGN